MILKNYFERTNFLLWEFERNYLSNMSIKLERVSDCLLFNAKLAIFQLYHGESKLDGDVRFVLDQHAYLDFYSAS